MRQIRCADCGKIIQASGATALCDKCRAARKRESVVRDRICGVCGAVFAGGPRAFYCPTCRAERTKSANAAYRKRARAGKARTIGSTDLCVICGGAYTVVGSHQRYCPKCAPEAIREADRQDARAWFTAHRERMAAQKKERSKSRKVCAVCGSPFYSGDARVTCSAACAAIQLGRRQAAAEYRCGVRKSPEYGVIKNKGLPKSGVTGVTWHSGCGKWQAVYRRKYIGLYDTVGDAAAAIQDYLRIKKEP